MQPLFYHSYLFQSHIGAIRIVDSAGTCSIGLDYFNPTLVQLESAPTALAPAPAPDFNPTLVQLEFVKKAVFRFVV